MDTVWIWTIQTDTKRCPGRHRHLVPNYGPVEIVWVTPREKENEIVVDYWMDQ